MKGDGQGCRRYRGTGGAEKCRGAGGGRRKKRAASADGAKRRGVERETGIEPGTASLGSWHSTAELLPPREQIMYSGEGTYCQRRSKPMDEINCRPPGNSSRATPHSSEQ